MVALANAPHHGETNAVNQQYWSQCCQKFPEEEINSMPSWLINAKK